MAQPLVQNLDQKDDEIQSDSMENRVMKRAKRTTAKRVISNHISNQFSFSGKDIPHDRENKRQKVEQVSSELSSGLSEDMDFVGMLSDEIWTEVIGWLHNPRDWLHLYYTGSYFRCLMDKKKVSSLFPRVLQIVHKKHDDISSTITTCRLVNKALNRSITNFFSYYPNIKKVGSIYNSDISSRMKSDPEFDSNHRTSPTYPIILDIDETEEIQSILEYWNNPQTIRPSPFFSRHLVIYGLPFQKKAASSRKLLLTFLKSVGPFIWHFAVHPRNIPSDSDDDHDQQEQFSSPNELTDWWKIMIKSLKFLPNLKTLLIEAPLKEFYDTHYLPVIKAIPHLPHLIVFQSISYMPETILKSFLVKNNHIKKCNLRICYLFCYWRTNRSAINFNSKALSNIAEFSLEIDFTHFESTCTSALPYFQLPVNKLVLVDVKLRLEDLANILKNIEGSLTHLYVHEIKGPESKDDVFRIGRIVTSFPKLRHVEFCIKQWMLSKHFDDGFLTDCLDINVGKKLNVFEIPHGICIRYGVLVVILRKTCFC